MQGRLEISFEKKALHEKMEIHRNIRADGLYFFGFSIFIRIPAGAVTGREKSPEQATVESIPNQRILEGIYQVYDHKFPEAEATFREVISQTP